MGTGRGRVLAAAAAVVASAALAGGVVAATQSSDEAALQPARPRASQDIERRIDALMAKMGLEDKLNQIQLLADFQITPAEAKKPVGGVFSLTDPELINKYQHIAVEESRLKIPILFAFDTIHGYRTIFPVPLGAASSFDPNVATQDHKFGARESAAVGLKQIYSPMVDVSHEPRWGRYIRDPVASLSQPVRRLRGFERVTLEPGQKRTVTFTLDKSDFGFHDNSGRLVVEPGQIDVYAGNSSEADLKQSFQVTG